MRSKKTIVPIEPKLIKVRKWVMEEKTFDDGKCTLVRTNDGFSTFELLGLADLARDEIISTIKGRAPHFDYIQRQIITDKP